MLKKILIGVGSLLGLLILATVILSFLIDEAKIFEVLTDSVEKETESKFIMNEDSAVSLFPTLGLNLIDVQLIPNDSDNSIVNARQVEIGVTLSSLLTGTVEIKTIRMVGLETKITQQNDISSENPKMRTDAELEAYYAEQRAKLEDGIAGQGLPPIPLDLEVGLLEVSDSAIIMHDPVSGISQTITIKKFNIEDLNTYGELTTINGDISISGETNIELKFQSELAIDLSEGTVKILETGMELGGLTPESVLIEASGDFNLNKETALLDIELSTDQMKAIGSLQRNLYQSPEIDMQLAINLIDPEMLMITDTISAASSQESINTTPVKSSTTLNSTQDENLSFEGLRNLDLRAQLEIDQVSLGPNILREVGASLRIVEGVLTLSEVTGEFNGGLLSLESKLDAKYNKAKFFAEGEFEGIDFNQVASSYGAAGVIAGTGNVSLNLSSSGMTQNEMIKNLSGPVTIKTSDISLQRISLEKTMCQGIALINKKVLSQSFPNNTDFASLGVNLKFHGGKAKIGPFSAELTSIKLDGSGDFDLLSNDFSLGLKGTIFESIGELDPACVLESKYANLVWPMNCEGNINGNSSDWCKVDTANVLAQLGKSTMKEKATKKAKTYIKKLFGG